MLLLFFGGGGGPQPEPVVEQYTIWDYAGRPPKWGRRRRRGR